MPGDSHVAWYRCRKPLVFIYSAMRRSHGLIRPWLRAARRHQSRYQALASKMTRTISKSPYNSDVEVFDMQLTRSVAFSFALFCAALPWAAHNSATAAPQNKPAAQPQDQSATLPLDGSKIFSNYCATCHGTNGNGNGPVAPALKTKVPDLTTLARRNGGKFPAVRVRGIIAGDERYAAHGSSQMPVWGPFPPDRIRSGPGIRLAQNVTEYLGTIQQK